MLITYLGYQNTGNDNFSRLLWNDYGVINSRFNIGASIWANRKKRFNIGRLGLIGALYNYCCFRINKTLPVYAYGHLPYPHLKSTLLEVWDELPDIARHTCLQRFRTDDQLSQHLFLAWNQAHGYFSPSSIDTSFGRFYSITLENLQEICSSIERKVWGIVCLNDSSNNTAPDLANARLEESFDRVFPEKSSFEI